MSITESTKDTFYTGFVLKNTKGEYYCENNDKDWWFDESIRFSCVFETTEEPDMVSTIQMLGAFGINTYTQAVEFIVMEKGTNH